MTEIIISLNYMDLFTTDQWNVILNLLDTSDEICSVVKDALKKNRNLISVEIRIKSEIVE